MTQKSQESLPALLIHGDPSVCRKTEYVCVWCVMCVCACVCMCECVYVCMHEVCVCVGMSVIVWLCVCIAYVCECAIVSKRRIHQQSCTSVML